MSRKTVTTETEEFDEKGNITKRTIVTVEEETDPKPIAPYSPPPSTPYPLPRPWWYPIYRQPEYFITYTTSAPNTNLSVSNSNDIQMNTNKDDGPEEGLTPAKR